MVDKQMKYDSLYIRSLPGKSDPVNVKTTTVPVEKYNEVVRKTRIKIKRALIAGIVGGMLFTNVGALTIEKGIPAIKEALSVSQELGSNYKSFDEEFIVPNTHRTEDGNHYLYYDTKEIAKGLSEYGDKDFDKNLYYCLQNLDSKNVDEILGHIDEYKYSIVDAEGVSQSRNFRHYLAENNYYDPDVNVDDDVLLYDDKAYDKAIDNFKETIRARVTIEQSMDEVERNYNKKQSELDEMLEDHNMDGPQVDKAKGL